MLRAARTLAFPVTLVVLGACGATAKPTLEGKPMSGDSPVAPSPARAERVPSNVGFGAAPSASAPAAASGAPSAEVPR